MQVDPKTNPANFIESISLRLLTKMMYGALHGWLMMVPQYLCCDWSGSSIPVVESIADPRNLYTLAFYATLIGGTIWAYVKAQRYGARI